MKYRIIQYIQPWEIDDLERQIHTMLLSSYYLGTNDTVVWDVTLNVSDTIVDWNTTKLPKSFFLEKFDYLKKLVNQYYVAEFDTDTLIQGCTDKRRSCQTKKHDFVINKIIKIDLLLKNPTKQNLKRILLKLKMKQQNDFYF
jgi:hypothetical protein